ncbi:MAG: hypothetical protein AAFO98_05555 [Pseudomonadota bacterium]
MQHEPLAMTDQFSREAARQMAKKAALMASQDYQARAKGGRRSTDVSLNRFALHTWGILAALSLVAGATATFNQSSNPLEFLAVTMSKPLFPEETRQIAEKSAPVATAPAEVAGLKSEADTGTRLAQTSPPELGNLRLQGAVDATTTGSVRPAGDQPISSSGPKPSGAPSALDTVSSRSFGMAISIESSKDVLERQYAALLQREPGLFADLSPVIEPISKKGGQAFSLVTGPFETSSAAARFCRQVQLRLTLTCLPQAYKAAQ